MPKSAPGGLIDTPAPTPFQFGDRNRLKPVSVAQRISPQRQWLFFSDEQRAEPKIGASPI
jgi:hypothetical protein